MTSPLIAVPDINIFISGTTIAQSYPAQAMELWRRDYYQLATSEPILKRMRQAYLYPQVVKFTGMSEAEVDGFLNDIRETAIVVPGTTPIDVSKDPEDNQLFSCAIEANADYIISGDKKHVLSVGSYQGIKTVSPKDFVAEILTT